MTLIESIINDIREFLDIEYESINQLETILDTVDGDEEKIQKETILELGNSTDKISKKSSELNNKIDKYIMEL